MISPKRRNLLIENREQRALTGSERKACETAKRGLQALLRSLKTLKLPILVTRASDQPKALGNSMEENMHLRVLIAKNWLFERLRRLLTARANMDAPIRDAFECSEKTLCFRVPQSSSLPQSRDRYRYLKVNDHFP